MRKPLLQTSAIAILMAVLVLLGCQNRPAVPTVPPEPTDSVIVVVVTATSQPTLATTDTPPAQPSITPIPTLTPIGTAATVTTTIPTATRLAQASATRPPATVAGAPTQSAGATTVPTAAQATVAPTTAGAANFPAPVVFLPENGKAFRDGDTITFALASIGKLAADECYRFSITLAHPAGAPAVSDSWVGLCGDQGNPGDRLSFQIKPARFSGEANYGSFLTRANSEIPPAPQFDMRCSVAVVKILNASDPIHPKVQAISPESAAVQNTFFR